MDKHKFLKVLSVALLVLLGVIIIPMWVGFAGFSLVPGNPVVEPSANANSVPLTSTISITYDEEMDPSTVSSQTFAIYGMQTGLLTEMFGVDGNTIFFTPGNPFKPGELVHMSATTGTLGISGSGPLAPTVWQFRAAVLESPGVFMNTGQNLGNLPSKDVDLGDLDGDGDVDAFVINWQNNAEILLNDGSGIFTDTGQHPMIRGVSRLELGDLDNDGDLDAFVGITSEPRPNEIWLNDGSGTFIFSSEVGEYYTDDLKLGDIDGDGDLDALFANTGPIEIWLNDGTGFFSESIGNLGTHYSYGIDLGDIDNDGDLDAIVVGATYINDNVVWVNNGNGIFTQSQLLNNDAISTDVEFGDVDNDGDLDIVIANSHDLVLQPDLVWLNDGTGHFVLGQSLGASYDSYTLALGDADGDDDLDFLVGTSAGTRLLMNDGSGHFVETNFSFGSQSYGVEFGDLNGDGTLDFFLANYSWPGSPNKVWVNHMKPVANPDTYFVFEDNVLEIPAPGVMENDFSSVNLPLLTSLNEAPVHGNITLDSDGSFAYSPDTDFYGTDTFTYNLSDDTFEVTTTVTITINQVNDTPILGFISDQTLMLLETFVITNTFSDPDLLDTHTITIQWTDTTTETLNLGAGITEFTADYLYAEPGTYTVTVTVTDDDGATDTKTFLVTVEPPEETGYFIYLPITIR